MVHFQGIRYHILIHHLKSVNKQFQLLRFHLGLYDIYKVMHHLGNIAFLLLNLYLAALNPAHIKDIINEAEKMVA